MTELQKMEESMKKQESPSFFSSLFGSGTFVILLVVLTIALVIFVSK